MEITKEIQDLVLESGGSYYKPHIEERVYKLRFSLPIGRHLHVVSKATPERNTIIDAADSMRTRVSTALLRTVEAVKDAISLKDLAEKLQVADLNGVLQILDLDKRFQAAAKGSGLQPNETSFLEAIKDTWAAGARAELDALGKVPVRKASIPDTIGLMLSFDLLNPETIAWLSSYVMTLIQQVSDETRRAIADVVMNAFQYGGHPYEQARTIKSMIGLTQSQSQAVANFRRMLENEPLAALTRNLRDHRFDATLQQVGRMKGQLSKEQIDKMADRYYARYLKYRAEMIARTETIRASALGQHETWRQAIAQGLLPQDMKRKWSVTWDDRLCPSCKSIPKLNTDGRGMDEQFMSDIGAVDGPPLHPHCRCAVVKKVDWGVSKAEEVEKGKGNPCHKPAGSSTGGQFCETKGASSTKAAVTGVLTELTEGVKNQYAKDVAVWYVKSAERFVNEVQQDPRFQNKNVGGVWGANYAFHKNAMKMYDEPIRVAVDTEKAQRGSMVAWNRNEPVSASTVYKLKPDYVERSSKAGREAADFMQQEFLAKNTQKLVPILDKKGNLQSTRLLSSSASQGTIEGDSRFTFTDGSSFIVRNKVILNFRNGKPYNQFPTTFHDVKLPGGKPMASPSEAKMAEVFGGAK